MGRGVSPHKVKLAGRAPHSDMPFGLSFVDMAQQAGLNQPTTYGGIDRKTYILETIGCGVAFLDYDNDGWQDIFVLYGTRMENPPTGATNRLYKNNRDGTFTAKAGLIYEDKLCWGSGCVFLDYDRDGYLDLFMGATSI